MRRTISTLVASLCLALGASFAHASTVKLDSFLFNGASAVTVATPSYSGQAGEFLGTLDGNPFTTFCADLLQVFYWGVSYDDYTVVDGTTAWGADREQLLGQLFTFASTSNFVTNADRSAAMQAGIWEILYETTSTSPHSFSTGSFQVSGTSNAGTTAALALLDWNAIASGPNAFNVSQLYSANEQDFIVLSGKAILVPEPSILALLMLGFAAIGFSIRRQR